MLRYQLAAVALKAFSLNSATKSAYRKIGNVVGERRRIEKLNLPIIVERGDLLVALVRKYEAITDGSRILEIGTGWMHWYSVYLRMFYEIQAVAFDVWDNRQFMALRSASTKLKPILDEAGAGRCVLDNVDTVIQSESFEDLYQKLGMSYVVEPSGSLDQFDDQTFDFITSFHVMEHIMASSVTTLAKSFARVIRPGGYMIHQIGIDDHLAHYDSRASKKQYIAYSDSEWNGRFRNDVQYFNRIQSSEWQDIFADAGFSLCEKLYERTDVSDLKVHPRFSKFSSEDLECTILTLVYRK